jgi:hypothetical protein
MHPSAGHSIDYSANAYLQLYPAGSTLNTHWAACKRPRALMCVCVCVCVYTLTKRRPVLCGRRHHAGCAAISFARLELRVCHLRMRLSSGALLSGVFQTGSERHSSHHAARTDQI